MKHIRFSVWFSVILVAAFIVGYLAWAYTYQYWPFDTVLILYPDKPRVFDTTKTYADQGYGFSFQYPEASVLEEPTITFFDGAVVAQLAQVSFPRELYPKTNLVEALFTVNSARLSPLNCTSQFTVPPSGDAKQVQISGNPFTFVKVSDAGAGNLYESRVYRGERGDTCFEIMLTIHTGNIGNYTAGSVTEVDKIKVWSKLTQILNSFKFTK
jgi:hypothetical protein